jgi:hypothetical protein
MHFNPTDAVGCRRDSASRSAALANVCRWRDRRVA